ncbi:MAG: patatin-like phospholipase family protein, partial [Nitrospira sp.]|nr:patatin-like phospholipase family protein [Nitrospira sp.]
MQSVPVPPLTLPDKSEAVQRGESILAGASIGVNDLLKLVDSLKRERKFGLARRLLDRHADKPDIREHAEVKVRIAFAQKRSLCTYKDPDLPADDRLDRALGILEAADPLAFTTDQETLGQAGAIYKRKWELTGIEPHLETSLAYYLRGFNQGVAKDYGYTAINAAFVLDLLAESEDSASRSAGMSNELADGRRNQARAIRQEIVEILPVLPSEPNSDWLSRTWWFLVTLGEAYFGVEDYDQSGDWLKKAAVLPNVPDWEWETTARQMSTLLRLQRKTWQAKGQPAKPGGERVLKEFLGGNFAAVTSVMQGKIGLALSGGGFRASLYHIGVLARLAELDLLRSIEFLSCVSGGSIVGAHYYLEVRHLLETKPDGEITRHDYVEVVRRVARDFLAGVERNVRTRIAAEWLTNMKMIFLPDYSRTVRAGDLYESEIYSRVADGQQGTRWLNKLFVRPKGDENLVPKDNNWRRSAKVPILILNATTLNTGHNWQFTASWMGEPPAGADARIDANYRLRRAYYRDLPKCRQSIRLGHAVAASACVPGLFDPLTLTGIYEHDGEPIAVRLVDGGVHDNQGASALLEQGCNVLLVSDASGQMDSQNSPSSGMLGVPLRSNTILQARVRGAEFQDLEARRRSGLLRGLMFVHLKKDLGSEPVDWIFCQDKSDPVRRDPLLPYGIQREVQRRLAAIRTDLDSFSEVEAYALMTSGYCMTEKALKESTLGFSLPDAPREDWGFLKVEPFMKEPGDTPLMRQLKVAENLAFKIWLLSRTLKAVSVGGGFALLVLIGYYAYAYWAVTALSLTVGALLTAVICIVLGASGWGAVAKIIQYRKTFQSILIGFTMATVGWFLARLHLHVFDRWFLRQGRLKTLYQ